MRIVTWNVNSIRARLPRLLPWLESRRPDAVLLQELKCTDDDFPFEELEAAGYHAAAHGQKTYNGVAILSRTPIDDVVRGMPDDEPDEERRVIAGTVGGVRLINVYVVNGQKVGSPAYEHKLRWLGRLHDYVAGHDLTAPLLFAGDFNITVDDRDVYDPKLWKGRILCSEPERAALRELFDLGLHDSLRRFHEEGGHFTWWDYRTRGFQRGQGMRIDHILLSDSAMSRCRAVDIDKEARAGSKPSDHAPVMAELD